MYLAGEVLFSLSWQSSCPQVAESMGLSPVAAPGTRSLALTMGWEVQWSAPALLHGSSPHLYDTGRSAGRFSATATVPSASCAAWPAPSHPNLPILAPQAFSSPAPRKAPRRFGFSSVETVSPQTPHLCLFILRVIWDWCSLVVQGKSRSSRSTHSVAQTAGRRGGLHPPVFFCDRLQAVRAAFLPHVFCLHRAFLFLRLWTEMAG